MNAPVNKLRCYGGYRFTPMKGFTPVCNPFNVLNAFVKLRIDDY